MKRINKHVLVGLLAVITVLGAISCHENTSEMGQDTNLIGAQASWSKGYTNLNDLVTDADLIATGEIVRVFETTQASEYIYFTNFIFRIENVLKGDEKGEIIIHQLGSNDKPSTVVIDDPLFETGENYLLFLYNSPSGVYSHSGPVTRYEIINNKVYSMNYVLAPGKYSAPASLDFEGEELSTITDRINVILDQFRVLSSKGTKLLSGETGTIDITLATGKYESGTVKYVINGVSNEEGGVKIPIPEGMTVSIDPAKFVVSPYNDYKSVITIQTEEQVIIPGEYWISIGYGIGESLSGQHILRVVIDEKKLSEIETRH